MPPDPEIGRGRPAGALAAFTVVGSAKSSQSLRPAWRVARSRSGCSRSGQRYGIGLVHVFFIVPFLALSPVAGVMVDRYNRKLMMMLSDLVAILPTVGLLLTTRPRAGWKVWHFYVAARPSGMAFQWPAYSAAITMMVPKQQLGEPTA